MKPVLSGQGASAEKKANVAILDHKVCAANKVLKVTLALVGSKA